MWAIKQKNKQDINVFIHKFPNINVSAICSSTREEDTETGRVFDCNAPININSQQIWYSYNETNTYTVMFHDFSVYLTSYSIQVQEDSAYPKQWTLHGIDYYRRSYLLSTIKESNIKSNYEVKVFENEGKIGPFKQFKFTSTGLNYLPSSHAGFQSYKYAFYLYKVDFFGFTKFVNIAYTCKSCLYQKRNIVTHIFVLLAQ